MFADLDESLTDMFDEFVRVKVRRQKDGPGKRLTLCDISANGLEGTSRVRGPALVLERDDLDFPRFEYLPRYTTPDTYHLHTWATESAEVLFTSELREWFSENSGWRVRGHGRVLVIYRLSEAGELDEATFVKTAQYICRLFRAGEHELDLRPEISREAAPDQIMQAAQGMPAPIVRRFETELNRQKVTPDEMSDFSRQSTPRQVPPGMKRQVLGNNYISECCGAVLLLMALGAIIKNHETVEHFAAIGVITCAGLAFIAYPFYRRFQKTRILREGIATIGEITHVTRMNVEVNNRDLYRIDVSYEVDGQEHLCSIKTYRDQADRARRLSDSETPVDVLYDPKSPRHCVCLDLIFVFD